MTTLNLVLDEILPVGSSDLSRYARELSRALVEHAPAGCSVEGIIGSSPEKDYAEIEATVPGLHGLFKSALTRRDLTTAWQHGFTPVPAGMIHAPSLFAPLRNHDRLNAPHSQISVTVHDISAWTHPEVLTPRQVSWTKAMAQRAFKYADAVVVPTHAMAAVLQDILPFGDRVRVLGAGAGRSLAPQPDAEERAARLELPDAYLLTSGAAARGAGFEQLLSAMALQREIDLPLLVIDPELEPKAMESAIVAARLPTSRVRALPQPSDADLSVVLSRARAFIYPSELVDFGMPMLEAFRLGVAVIHSDAAPLVEIAGEAGLAVPAGDAAEYPRLLGESIANVVEDNELRSRLGILGADRARMFTWRAPAEAIWQLHADL